MLRIEGLVYAHPGASSLAFPDFESLAGEAVIVRGPSGSGKSTLLALIAGLLTVQRGSLSVAGTDVAALSGRARDAWRGRTLGVVPQRLHLSERLDVQRNLELAYVAAGIAVDRERIADLLDRLGLQGLAARRPHELSVGQAQRVAMARALLRSPRVLLADEPTSNLDDAAAESALALLSDATRAAQASLVVATHDARVRAALPAARELLLTAGAR